MPNSIGGLIVSLGLDAAGYTSGLTKSEALAKKFGQQMQTNVAAGIIKAQVAMEALIGTARLAREVFQGLTQGTAAFKDLEEITGAAAESIASFAVAGATAGVEVSSIAESMNKLTKNLVGVDDESQAAGAALGALGLNVKDFKQLDPAAQYEAVGKALGGFADGASKTAVAIALFGKAGAEQLKVFKALEEQGGRTAILTQRQIELADEYADKQAKTIATVKLYAQAFAADAIPALTEFSKAIVEAISGATGLDTEAGRLSASKAVREWAFDQAEGVAELIGKLQSLGLLFAALATSSVAAFESLALVGGVPSKVLKAMDEGATLSAALTMAMQDQRVAVTAAKTAWDSYLNFDESKLAKRLAAARSQGAADELQRPIEDRGFRPPKAADGRQTLTFTGPTAADKAAALLKKQLDGQLQALKDFADSQKAAYDFASRVTQDFYTDGLISLASNIEAQKAIRSAALSSLVQSLDDEIAALERSRAKLKKPEEVADTDNKITAARAKRTTAILEGGRQEVLANTEAERSVLLANTEAERSVLQLKQAYDDLVAGVRTFGDDAGAAQIRIAKQVADARRLISSQRGGDQGVADELDRRLRQQQQLTEAQKDYGRLIERARDQEEGIMLAAQERGDSEIETLRQLRDSRQAALRQLEQMAGAAQQLAAATGSPDSLRFAEQLALQLKRATAEADPLLLKLRDVGKEAGGAIAGAFEDAVLSGKSLDDVLKDLEKSLVRIAYQQLVTKPLEQYLGGAIGGNGQASGGGGWLGALLGLFGGGGAAAAGGDAAASFGGVAAGAILGAAIGGPVPAYGVRRVAENRPEVLDVQGEKFLLMGNRRGSINPTPELGRRGGGQSVVMNFTLNGPTDRRTQMQIGSEAARALGAASVRNG